MHFLTEHHFRQLTVPAILFVPYLDLEYTSVVSHTFRKFSRAEHIEAEVSITGQAGISTSARYRDWNSVCSHSQHTFVALSCPRAISHCLRKGNGQDYQAVSVRSYSHFNSLMLTRLSDICPCHSMSNYRIQRSERELTSMWCAGKFCSATTP